MNRVQDLKQHIVQKYPKLSSNKFDIAKIGARIYMYFVDSEGNLQREQLFRGALPAVNELQILKKQLDANIQSVMEKWNYC
jgi:hypothetical protein